MGDLNITPGPWVWGVSSKEENGPWVWNGAKEGYRKVLGLSSPTGAVINLIVPRVNNPWVPAWIHIDNPSDRAAIEAVPLYENLRKATNTLRAAVKALMTNPLDYNLRKAAESAGYEVDAAIEALNAALEKAEVTE